MNHTAAKRRAPDVHADGSEIRLDISGMTCAACATRVEKALRGVPGVARVTVNLATERAAVNLADDPANLDALLAAVQRIGYAAREHADAGATVGPDPRDAAEIRAARRDLAVLIASILLTLPLVAQMGSMLLDLPSGLTPEVQAALATPVQFWVGGRFYRSAWRALKARSGNMDLLVALGTSVAYGYSLAQVIRADGAPAGHLYFEASAIIITMVMLGKWLESGAKRGTTAAIRELMALRPETARIERLGSVVEVPITAVAVGDIAVVRPGERIPIDGRIIAGETEIDESLITGESLPVVRRKGDSVTGGAINGTGLIRVHASAVGEDSTLARIIRLVENAQAGKAPVQRLVDRVSAVFVPIVIALAVITFAGWLVTGGPVEQAVSAAVAVLVIACPCALGLATPTAIVAGTGAAARAGILIKDIEAIERAHRVDLVIFDKTGTLTEGRPEVVAIEAIGGDESALLTAAAGLQSASEHPLARAVLAYAADRGISPPQADDVRARPGEGIVGTVAGQRVAIGTPTFLRSEGIADGADQETAAGDAERRGHSVMLVAIDGRLAGWIAVADPLRADSAAAVAALTDGGVEVEMLSGDSETVARVVANELGVRRYRGSVRPEDKAKAIEEGRQRGRVVAMVGDGINDAPALAAADVGIAMGSGSDVAMETAGITLMRPDARLVPAALGVSRATWTKIRQNLFWAFIYNLVGIPLAAFGLLNPALAGAAMALSSASVVSNSLLLRRWRPSTA
jgi:Cu+-exporting ATPase